MNILKLGTIVTDTVTEQKGMLTIFCYDMNMNTHYLFQPAGLNPKTKQPLDTIWINKARIEGAEQIEVELPNNVMGTFVEDKATGFNGKVVQLFYYLNGCIHLDVKPKGVIDETGETIAPKEFDIRRLKGDAIKNLTEEELNESKKTKPSPESRPAMDKIG